VVTPADVVTALRAKGHQTAVVAATGPSLAADDLASVRDRALVIGVSDVGRFYPWVDAVYAADARWWTCHKGLPEYDGLKASIEREAGADRRDHPWPDVAVFKHYGTRGLEVKHRDGLRTNDNSGAQAINLAVHAGVARILLLGFDMDVKAGSPSHFFGEHPDEIRSRCWEPYTRFRPCFDTMKAGLQATGVEVINCSRETVLKTFPRMALAEALRVAVAA
jgi:hypothetical protein